MKVDPNNPHGYIDGFNWKTVIGAFFVGIVMMPASIYISMFAGSGQASGLTSAAEWVTIILFAELARRSIATLKKQEVYLLYHVAGALAGGVAAGGIVGGGVFTGLIWNQYLRTSREAEAFDVPANMPDWAAPVADSEGIVSRMLWHPDWYWAIGLILVGQILGRMNWFGLGYALFRLTSDVERLPFPLATIAAEGATALAESPERKESWRWRLFSIGTMLGLGFGLLYIALPAITGVVFTQPIFLFPIPWVDFTQEVGSVLPAAMVNISFDGGMVIVGMVVPFWIVVGTFVMTILTSVCANPFLQQLGMFPHWKEGMDIISTSVATSFDFWMSISIGATLSVAVVGIWQLYRILGKKKSTGSSSGPTAKPGATEADILIGKEGQMFIGMAGQERGSLKAPKGRGDFSVWVGLTMFLVSTSGYVWICHWLVPDFPLVFLIFYGFFWTPLMSYISARMFGLTGRGIAIPFVKEASFMLSGYKGVDIWFAPIPLSDFGWVTMRFKQLELTRTKFTSFIKAELLMMPINIVFSFIFWSFFWYVSAIPSAQFPFIAKMWPFMAIQQSLIFTATGEGRQWLLEALRPIWLGTGFVGGLAMYAVIAALKWPVFLFYGAVGGINQFPNGPLLMLIGALLGRYYFARKFTLQTWFRYIPVLAAGFFCGAGLVGMLAVGLVIINASVVTKPF
jgi:hypothetical protein